MSNLDSILKSRDITLSTKVCLVKAMVFPVVVYGCESWTIKKAERWRIDAFELWCWIRLESPLDYKEIQPAHPKENQSWIFIGRTDAEAETPVLWPPDVKNGLTGKDPDTGKAWRQEERGTTEDEMIEWHHQLNGYEFEQVSRVGSWWWTGKPGKLQSMELQRLGHDWVTELNWTELNGLSCPEASGILVPRPGIKPESPALEGGFLTTEPPGKSLPLHFISIYYFVLTALSSLKGGNAFLFLMYLLCPWALHSVP